MPISNTVIKVENISKQYRLGNIGLGTIGADLNCWWQTGIRGNEDPVFENWRRKRPLDKRRKWIMWALRHIIFEVKEGEVLNIIGALE